MKNFYFAAAARAAGRRPHLSAHRVSAAGTERGRAVARDYILTAAAVVA